MAISLKTHKMLWGRSGNRCALPSCRRVLVEDETETDDPSVVGDEAHIVAREEDGPRGKSALSADERDKYGNLILMCKVHHKLIDDQVGTYTVEYLNKLKEEHVEWINKNLSPDSEKQKDDEIYATYIDRWVDLAGVDYWKPWTSHLLSGGQPQLSSEVYDNLRLLNEYLLSRVWPRRYPQLEFSLTNFRIMLNDFLNVFDKYKEKWGSEDDYSYITEKFYRRLQDWDVDAYRKISEKYDFHVDLVQDLVCELTRAANYVCHEIRRHLSASFRINEGLLLIETGPDMSFSYTTVRLEYESFDKEEVQYRGLEDFMVKRSERRYHFGSGICNDYLPRKYD